MTSRCISKYAALNRGGELADARATNLPISIGLADEQGTPHEGKLVFMDNALDAQTGTIRATRCSITRSVVSRRACSLA